MTSPYGTGVIGTYSLSGNSQINPLAWTGFKWGSSGAGTSAAVTYSFPTYGSLWHSDYANYLDNEPNNNFQPFDAAQQNAAEQALALWSQVANITFTKVDDLAGDNDVGDIRFGNSGAVTNSSSAAWAYLPYDDIPYQGFVYAENGDVWFDHQHQPNLKLAPGQFGFSTMIHEIGHAIGLDHPFNDGDGPPETAVPAAQANQRYSIMAYNLYSGASPGFEAYGPMLYDILAIQYIYGANMTTRAGNDVYTFQTDKEYLECIWDAGGQDTIDLSNQTRNQVIDLHAGTFSSIGVKNNGATAVGNIGIAFGVTIENATGGKGADKITGNDVDNILWGGAGNDTMNGADGNDAFEGGTGADSMSGGKGDDFFAVDNVGDKVIEAAGGGFDTIQSEVSYSLVLFKNVEMLQLMGTGNLNATGSTTDNSLIGTSGNNVLDGGAGADFLSGGAGNDVYVIDNVGDAIEEVNQTDSGDEVRATFRLSSVFDGVENYIYLGSGAWTFTGDANSNQISGGSGNDDLSGAGGNDKLLGNGGNDTLDGGADDDWLEGGLGNDKMRGGTGNDTYVINAAGDTIEEQGADADDLVRTSVTVNLVTLGLGLIENAMLLGTTAINATGNDLDNDLTGNIGANILNGGKGADILTGDKGADTYFVDNAGDKVIETIGGAAGGIDIVKSSVTFDLTTHAFVENVTLTEGLDIDAIGNGLNNILIGNSGANRLDGGLGSDAMTGGAGDDTYVVNAVGDVVNETVLNNKGGGVDTVESAVTYSLAARTNIENLTLTGGLDINGTGNALVNIITGSTGKNILDGGVGADNLKGGAGNDTYIFDNLGDTANEEANTDSADLVKTSVLITAGISNIENYTFTGAKAWTFTGTTAGNIITGGSVKDSLSGGDGNDTLLGNGGNDALFGEVGDDLLDGGAGNDKMQGGAGNDTYVINALTDVIDEETNLDTDDWVKSSVSVSLLSAAFLAIEHVELVGTAVKATGDTDANKLTGNAAANVLDGGDGADTLIGGNGADTYFVDAAGDQVKETTAGAAGGIDLVMSSISYTLGDNVEKLTLAVGAGSIDATGNALNNTLLGNEGVNILDGLGGNDTMTGGKGDDTYVVDKAGDVVNETVLNSAGGGEDTVQSAVTFTLATRTNIEHLTLTGVGNINGTGNALNNEIIGNEGNNVLNGGAGKDILEGGDGNDKLTGGAGNDTFDFNLVSELGDLDTITDFSKAVDKLDISDLLDGVSYAGSDVFADGYVSFTYNGTTTNVLFDQDGLDVGFNATALASLLNVNLTSADIGSFIVETV